MPATGDIYELAMRFLIDGEEDALNVYDFAVTAGTCTDAELLTALAATMTTAYGYLSGIVANNVDDQTSPVSKLVWSGTQWIVDTLIGYVYPTITFTNTADALPYQNSPLVRFLTVFPRVVGKKYLPPFTEGDQADSVISGTALAAMVNFGDQIRTVLTPGSASVSYVVLTKTGGYVGAYGTTANAIMSSQKRRKIGVGS